MEKSFVFTDAPFASCHASTIVEARPGRFLAAWFGGSREGAPDVAIWLSRHDGRGWSAPEAVAAEPEVPCWNPVLFRERGGRVFLFFKAGPSPREWSGFYHWSDDGERWSGPLVLPAGLLGPVRNKPIQLASGRIVSGTSVESYRAWAAWAELSDDGGATWRRAGPIALADEPRGVIQPAVFEAGGGLLRMLLRSSRAVGRIGLAAESADGGETWSAARRTEMPNPNSGIDAARLEDGRVVLCHNPTASGRTPLLLSVSEDGGLTFRQRLTLESDPGEYSYPAIIEASDGRVHVTYTWRRQRIAHAVMDRGEL